MAPTPNARQRRVRPGCPEVTSRGSVRSTRNPAAGLAKSGPWYLTDKVTLVAPNWATVQTGTLAHNITLNASGSPGPAILWTNTNTDGTPTSTVAFGTCNDWTDASPNNGGYLAHNNGTGSSWTTYALGGCQSALALYCFQQ